MLYKIKFLNFGLIPLLILFITLQGCDEPINIFSVQDDATLGKQLDSTIRSNPAEYPLYNYKDPNNYVQAMINEIVASPLIKYRQYFPYKVQIINNDKIVNAFATPGGYIYVYTGLIRFLDNEATLAGILAHEVAHAERRHATNRMTKAYGIQVLLSIVLGNNPSMIEQIASNLFTGLYLLKNSRDDEYEADEYSFKYLQSTQWYPGAISFFFDKVKKDDGNSIFETLLSTHPMPQDRIDNVNRLIKEANLGQPNENNIFSVRYTNFKKSMP